MIDGRNGEVAVIAMMPQSGLSQPDAEHTAGLLNDRAAASITTRSERPRILKLGELPEDVIVEIAAASYGIAPK